MAGEPHESASAGPAVSVVIPCYRATEHIAEALESLRAQTFRDFEVILVNDACPDSENLERALAPYRDEIVYIRQERNQGPSAARNAGIRAARAPLIAMLDSDDAWESNYLEVQTGMLRAWPEVDVVYPNAVFAGESSWAGRAYMDMVPSAGEADFRSILRRECNVFTGVTARREALLRAGMFDPALRRSEDFDLWLRLARSGAKFKYHREKLVRYRLSADSLSDDKVNLQTSSLEVYQKLMKAPDLSDEHRALVSEAIGRQQATIDLFLGKKALYSRDRREALKRLSNANRTLRNGKLAAKIWMLRIWPWPLYRYIHYLYPTEYSYLH